ncbi:MAG: Gfo/Idh/MocA family oxidoreductase [Sumerlaeia bacterium]
MLRIAVIGLGDMGAAHARGFDRLDDCRVVATADRDAAALAIRPIEWRHEAPRHYTDFRRMLADEKPDAVVIAVPDDAHREVAEACLDAGADLLLEKPISNTIGDCDAIIAKAERCGAVLQIGLVYRYSNLYRRMAELSADPAHPVRLMWCKELRQCFPQKPWFYSQAATGGTMVEKDCHHFDLFNWMIGSRPTRVWATGGQHVWKDGSIIDCDYCPDPPLAVASIDTVDHALVTIDYENGGRASLILCMYLRPHNVMPEGLEVGAISLSGRQMIAYQDARLGVGGLGQPLTFERMDMLADNEGIGHIGCQTQRREFLDACARRTVPTASAEVGRDALLIALAAERSLREGRPIEISEIAPCLAS